MAQPPDGLRTVWIWTLFVIDSHQLSEVSSLSTFHFSLLHHTHSCAWLTSLPDETDMRLTEAKISPKTKRISQPYALTLHCAV